MRLEMEKVIATLSLPAHKSGGTEVKAEEEKGTEVGR